MPDKPVVIRSEDELIRLRAAVTSAYVHAQNGTLLAHSTPVGFRLMPLAEIVACLVRYDEEKDPEGYALRSYAAAVLVSGGVYGAKRDAALVEAGCAIGGPAIERDKIHLLHRLDLLGRSVPPDVDDTRDRLGLKRNVLGRLASTPPRAGERRDEGALFLGAGREGERGDDLLGGLARRPRLFDDPALNGGVDDWRSSSMNEADLEIVRLDPRSMVTTCAVGKRRRGKLDLLSKYINPLCWSSTAPTFWRASRRVLRTPSGSFIEPTPLPDDEPWEGMLFEDFAWSFDGHTTFRFRNYLNVAFALIDGLPSSRFSLFLCQGSEVLLRITQGGLDVDSGGFEVVLDPASKGGRDGSVDVGIFAVKRLRFTDFLSRRTPAQGAMYTGQTLNFLTPALLGISMDGLIDQGLRAWEMESSVP